MRLVKSTCGLRYDQLDEKKFIDLMSYHPERLEHQNFWWKSGNVIYAYPFREEFTVKAILENPLDGKIIQTDLIPSGSLIPGETYKVTDGNITYNSTTYQRGDTFTATTAAVTYTGSGEVLFNASSRDFTYDDEFPMNGQLWGFTKQRIIRELRASQGFIGDAVQDDADEESMQESRQ